MRRAWIFGTALFFFCLSAGRLWGADKKQVLFYCDVNGKVEVKTFDGTDRLNQFKENLKKEWKQALEALTILYRVQFN